MKEINFECPCCHNIYSITVDKNFKIISVTCQNNINSQCKFKDVEFGILKEGDK